MCMLVEQVIKTDSPLYAFVLRQISLSPPYQIFPLLGDGPLQKSKSHPAYFEDPLWNPNFKLKEKVSQGVFHCITRLDDAMDSFLEDCWEINNKKSYRRIGLFLVEIPPSPVIYKGVHFGCSLHLNYKKGWGVQYYRLVCELTSRILFRTSEGTLVYRIPRSLGEGMDELILQMRVNNMDPVVVVPLGFNEVSSVLSPLEAAEVMAKISCFPDFYREKFGSIG